MRNNRTPRDTYAQENTYGFIYTTFDFKIASWHVVERKTIERITQETPKNKYIFISCMLTLLFVIKTIVYVHIVIDW